MGMDSGIDASAHKLSEGVERGKEGIKNSPEDIVINDNALKSLQSKRYKVAHFYLQFVSIYYVMLGLAMFTTIGAVFPALGRFLVVMPEALISSYTTCNPPIGCWPSYEIGIALAVIATPLGIWSFWLGRRIERSLEWVHLWYGLSGFAFLVAISNFFIDPTGGIGSGFHNDGNYMGTTFLISNLVLALSYLVATLMVHQGLQVKRRKELLGVEQPKAF